jgi:hypothetical protein
VLFLSGEGENVYLGLFGESVIVLGVVAFVLVVVGDGRSGVVGVESAPCFFYGFGGLLSIL